MRPDNIIYARLSRAIQAYQRKNRALVTAHTRTLSLPEAHVLVEVDAHGEISFSELARRLLLSRAAVGRYVMNLRKRKLLKAKTHQGEARRLWLSLTERASSTLKDFDSNADRNIESFATALNKKQQKALFNYLERLADALGIPKSPYRAKEHVLRPTVRRLTRRWGLMGESVMGFPVSPLQWHSLTEIMTNRCRFARDLSEWLNVPKNTLSMSLKQLVNSGLIVREKLSEDRRIEVLSITNKGKALLNKIEKSHIRDLRKAFPLSHRKEVKDFTFLMERFMGISKEERDGSPLSIIRLRKDGERALARKFLVEWHTKKDLLLHLPELILSKGSDCFALRKEQDMVAICEIRNNGQNYTLTNSCFMEDIISSSAFNEFIKECVDKVLSDGKGFSLFFELPESIVRELNINKLHIGLS